VENEGENRDFFGSTDGNRCVRRGRRDEERNRFFSLLPDKKRYNGRKRGESRKTRGIATMHKMQFRQLLAMIAAGARCKLCQKNISFSLQVAK